MAERVHREGPLNERDAVGWVIRLAKRVERLHELGVAHGGISADCIVVEGPSYVAAGMLGDVREAATRPAYHCPERHAGHGISPQDDAWALAVTLYYLLTGQLPFAGETSPEIARRIETSAPAPLAVFDVGDDDLQGVLDQFLQRNPTTRIAQAARLRRMLEAWHPDPAVGDLPPLDEAEGLSDIDDDGDDDEENIQTVMRDFSDVRRQIEALTGSGGPELLEGSEPRPFARAGAPGPPAGAEGWRARHKPNTSTQVGGFSAAAAAAVAARDADAMDRPTALGGFAAASAQALAARDRPPEQPDKPTTAMGGFAVQQARREALGQPLPPVPPPPGPPRPPAPPPPRPGALPGIRSEPPPPPTAPVRAPQFDIEDDDSEDDIATVMMDTEGTDLSAQIEKALSKSAPPAWQAPPPAAAAGAPGPGASPAFGAPPPVRTPPPQDFSLEHLLENQPQDSGLKRALIVGSVLLVIVVTTVVLLWLGQEGKL